MNGSINLIQERGRIILNATCNFENTITISVDIQETALNRILNLFGEYSHNGTSNNENSFNTF